MNDEKTISEIEWLERLYSLPDTRPLQSPNDNYEVQGHTQPMEVKWPDRFHPENSAVHVRNELLMSGVQLERVWAWLCRPDLWPTWYPNSANVRIKNQTHLDLRPGTEFRWKTFGVTIDSTVREFVLHERLAWDAHCNGVHAYHAWALECRGDAVYALTEETQNGWLARLGALLMPNRMRKWHQLWLEGLEQQARKALP